MGQFLSDPRRSLFLIIVLLAIVLTAILTFSVSSCVGARNQPSTGQVVPVGSAGQDSSDQGVSEDDASADPSTDNTEEDQGTSGDATGDQETDGEGEQDASAGDTAEETIVEVSVADGQVSWVEITCDGESVIADSVTGPWSQSFTVHDSITIQVADTDVVTVTENGEQVDFTSHAGGLGSVTIEGTPLPEEGTDGTNSAEGTDQPADESTE